MERGGGCLLLGDRCVRITRGKEERPSWRGNVNLEDGIFNIFLFYLVKYFVTLEWWKPSSRQRLRQQTYVKYCTSVSVTFVSLHSEVGLQPSPSRVAPATCTGHFHYLLFREGLDVHLDQRASSVNERARTGTATFLSNESQEATGTLLNCTWQSLRPD